EDGPDVVGRKVVGRERELLEKPQRCAELLIDRGRFVVGENEPHRVVAEGCLRDRGVSVRSKDTLVESRDECRKHLALTDGPCGWTAHHLLRELGEPLAEEALSIEQRADN